MKGVCAVTHLWLGTGERLWDAGRYGDVQVEAVLSPLCASTSWDASKSIFGEQIDDPIPPQSYERKAHGDGRGSGEYEGAARFRYFDARGARVRTLALPDASRYGSAQQDIVLGELDPV